MQPFACHELLAHQGKKGRGGNASDEEGDEDALSRGMESLSVGGDGGGGDGDPGAGAGAGAAPAPKLSKKERKRAEAAALAAAAAAAAAAAEEEDSSDDDDDDDDGDVEAAAAAAAAAEKAKQEEEEEARLLEEEKKKAAKAKAGESDDEDDGQKRRMSKKERKKAKVLEGRTSAVVWAGCGAFIGSSFLLVARTAGSDCFRFVVVLDGLPRNGCPRSQWCGGFGDAFPPCWHGKTGRDAAYFFPRSATRFFFFFSCF